MKLLLHWKRVPPSTPLRSHLERRLEFSLGRFAPRIRQVRALLADDNGDRGGLDKSCRLEVRCGGDLLRVTGRDRYLNTAIDSACDRMHRTLARLVDRQHFQNSGRWRVEGLLRRRHATH